MPTIEIGSTTYTIPESSYWSDEFEADPVAQNRETALDGSIHIFETALQGGRPITLKGAWAPRSALVALREASETTEPMTLSLDDGRTFTVRWRRPRGRPAVEGTPVYPVASPGDDHQYQLTLRFITV